jgi:hypothetical protein
MQVTGSCIHFIGERQLSRHIHQFSKNKNEKDKNNILNMTHQKIREDIEK